MKQLLSKGKYIIAVSGGVDSIVLLNMLIVNKLSNIELIVAHFDHGIRPDSYKDKELVKRTAEKYGLKFESESDKLGPKASEEAARTARYKFLESARQRHRADAIVTAHHQDDVLETVIINVLRGTGRRGLSSLKSEGKLLRPLLGYTKQELLDYAVKQKLDWREDTTNNDTAYLRNYIRQVIIPKLSDAQKKQLVAIYETAHSVNIKLDILLDGLMSGNKNRLDKKLLLSLPHVVAKELIAHWLRRNNRRDFDSKIIERIAVDAKRLQTGKRIPVYQNAYIEILPNALALVDSSKD